MSFPPETFDQFYARISANRKAEILACADPVKRVELEAWDSHFETQYKAAWQMEQSRKARFQSAVTGEEHAERRSNNRSGGNRWPSQPNDQHRTYQVINGKAS